MNAFRRTFGFINQHPLAKRHLIKSYLRFIFWQFRSRIYFGLIKVHFLEKTYFLAKKGLTGLTGNIYTGLHEFNDMGFLLHFLRSGDTFFDVGANVGSYTLLASSVCKAKSISFEPIPQTYDILKQNIELNKIVHLVQAENKGVGKEVGNLKFTTNGDTTNHVLIGDDGNTAAVNVPVVTLDGYYPSSKPALLKIDVEGFETEVLNGASSILQDNCLKAIIIELIGGGAQYGYDENEIHLKLLDLSFKSYTYDPITRALKELQSIRNSNTIYIRDLAFVEKRLNEAKPFEIFNEKI
ncbi:methyltransferase, FkbM family [Pedobacter insulae]|uniref:Methyltransferase, FkbM family n=2 Tax=Pedobacter insulae TaxID=414048 RepID=A0A1I2VVC5_9SPHI|nr:methyltransferase, FkbM family [Pedobacter insulae]